MLIQYPVLRYVGDDSGMMLRFHLFSRFGLFCLVMMQRVMVKPPTPSHHPMPLAKPRANFIQTGALEGASVAAV